MYKQTYPRTDQLDIARQDGAEKISRGTLALNICHKNSDPFTPLNASRTSFGALLLPLLIFTWQSLLYIKVSKHLLYVLPYNHVLWATHKKPFRFTTLKVLASLFFSFPNKNQTWELQDESKTTEMADQPILWTKSIEHMMWRVYVSQET